MFCISYFDLHMQSLFLREKSEGRRYEPAAIDGWTDGRTVYNNSYFFSNAQIY